MQKDKGGIHKKCEMENFKIYYQDWFISIREGYISLKEFFFQRSGEKTQKDFGI